MAKAIMRKDLTGQRFGLLTVRCVDEERSGNGKVYWICDCDCGGETSILSTSLTRKKNGTKSCGCLKHIGRITNNTKIDMVGKRFGRLTVREPAGYKIVGGKGRKKPQWLCDCDCGGEIIVIGESLRSGITTSCGCVYKESRRTIAKVENVYDLTSFDYGVGYCQNGKKFYFDKEDYEKIKDYCWSYDGRYVQAHTHEEDDYSTALVRLHRIILDVEDRKEINVDHINGITYDCRKSNLRLATNEENGRNKKQCFATPNNPVGISKIKGGKYTVLIADLYCGVYDTFEEAFTIRKEKEKEIYGDFCWNPNAQKIDEAEDSFLVS